MITATRPDLTVIPSFSSGRAAKDMGLAITGMECLFPDAIGIHPYWQNILSNRCSIHPIQDPYLQPFSPKPLPTQLAALMPSLTLKPQQFRIPPTTARNFDPRVLPMLEVVQRLLEAHPQVARQSTLVLLCCQKLFPQEEASTRLYRRMKTLRVLESLESYQTLEPAQQARLQQEFGASYDQMFPQQAFEGLLAESSSLMCSIMSKTFNLGGGHISLDATCASTISAIQLAWNDLEAGHHDAALIVALSPEVVPSRYSHYAEVGIFTNEAVLPLDANPSGTALGEGIGAMLLQRLPDAVQTGEPIHGVIRGVGFTSDGKGSGFVSPQQEGQVRAMQAAYEMAGIEPDQVRLVEAHATGTPKGDVTELDSLGELFDSVSTPTVLGSVKGNIGHLLAASGMAGIFKVCCAMQAGVMPPTIFRTPRPELRERYAQFRLLDQPQSWPEENYRFAAVSSFGFGGVNAHLLLEAHASTAQGLPTPSSLISTGALPSAPVSISEKETAVLDPTVNVPSSASSTMVPPPVDTAAVQTGVFEIVAECTGYGVDELQLEHDLDADLGIDSLKNMEILLKVGERFQVQAQDGDQITDYPTIAALVELAQTRQNTATPEDQADALGTWMGESPQNGSSNSDHRPQVTVSLENEIKPTQTVPQPLTEIPDPISGAEVELGVMQIVADCTGYEVNELQLEHDLDADLGIDSLKNMEILLKVGEQFRVQAQDGDQITDYPTIASLVELAQTRQNTATPEDQVSMMAQLGVDEPSPGQIPEPPPAPSPESSAVVSGPESSSSGHPLSDLEVGSQVMQIVADCTGYEVSELQLEHDLDADLGIDSLKNMEILLKVGERFHVQAQEGEQITDYPTIASLVELARTRQNTATEADQTEVLSQLTGALSEDLPPAAQEVTPAPDPGPTAEAALEVEQGALTQVQRTVAQLRNYDPDWLKPHLFLIADLGLEETELTQVFNELGLPPNGSHDWTLAAMATALRQHTPSPLSPNPDADLSTQVPLPPASPGMAPATEDWTLVIGRGAADDPTLATQIQALLAADPDSAILQLPLPTASLPLRPFALVVNRAAPTWALEIPAKLIQSAGHSLPLQGIWWGEKHPTAAPMAWICPGSGSLYPGLLTELQELSPVVREVIQSAQQAYQDLVGEELSFGADTDPLKQRPATVTVSTALARLLQCCGLTPDLLAGHSVGELTACHLAGLFDLRELIRLTAAPFKDLPSLPQGRMVALLGPERQSLELVRAMAGRVVISNRNSPQQIVISGSEADIQQVMQRASEVGLSPRPLDVQTPYHSPTLATAHQHYRQALGESTFQSPQIPIVSGLTGDLLPWSSSSDAQTQAVLDCAFIAPVNHVAQLRRLQELGMGTVLDVGPTQRLARLAKETLDPSELLILGANHPKRSSRQTFLDCLAQLFVQGYPIQPLSPPSRRSPIPTVPLQAAASTPVPAAPSPAATIATPALEIQRPTVSSPGSPPVAPPPPQEQPRSAQLDLTQRRPMMLDPIAIIGIGALLPDAGSAAEFWQNLLSGHSAIREIPQGPNYRWDVNVFYDPDRQKEEKTYSKIGAFVPEIPFKPMEFRIPPKTAAQMDRAQKLALLATREAFANSGYDSRPFDRQRVKVVIGTSLPEFSDRGAPRLFFDQIASHIQQTEVFQSLPAEIQSQILTQARASVAKDILTTSEDTTAGGLPNVVAGRVAFCFDLKGGNVVLDAACAGSLAAIDHAVKCLRLGEADMVISGGSDTNMSPSAYVGFCKTHALSAERSCPFDAAADGFVMGEGTGIVILKRLRDAEADGDPIQAVIRGVGSASDGKGKGITAPSSQGQQLAIRRAYEDAGIDPGTVGFLEAHGTSTPVGDVVEFDSLVQIFGGSQRQRPILLGSVKSMIGHLKGAAGVAGLIKAVMSLRTGQIPPTLNFNTPHPKIDLQGNGFAINTTLSPWEHDQPTPRRAGVNAFGFGGTNYHVVLEAYDPEFYRSRHFQEEVQASHLYQTIYRDLPLIPELPSANGSAPAPAQVAPADLQPVTDLNHSLQSLTQPLVIQSSGDRSQVSLALGSERVSSGSTSLIPAIRPQDLGAASFRRDHGVRFNYIAGAMAGGIGSVDIVVDMAKAGLLGFYGSGGVPLDRVEQAIQQVQERLLEYPQAVYGFNLLHNPVEPSLEERTVDLYLKYGVKRVSASAFMRLTPSVVRYRARGMRRLPDGRIEAPHHVFAKVSSPEIAAQFMAPPPAALLKQLVSQGALTAEEAELAALLPVAQDVTAEADSGGHTDRRPMTGLLPQLLRLRDQMMLQHRYGDLGVELRVGAGGSIGDPLSVRAALALGADYILTGSINQCSLQAGTSGLAKQMLAQAAMTDVVMAPAADMFEMGVQVQILKRGTFYPQRSRKLYAIYKTYDSLEAIPTEERAKLERDIFRQPLDEVWASTADYWQNRDPQVLEKANRDPKFKMALAFRAYLGLSSRWAQKGQEDRKSDFQIWCGPAMGLFNSWVSDSWLAELENRDVVLMGLALLHGAAVLARAEPLLQAGVPLPSRLELTQPAPRETLVNYL